MHRRKHKIAKLTRPLKLAEHPLYKRPDPPHLEPPVDLTGLSGFWKYHHAVGWPDSAVPAEMSNIPRYIVPFAFYFNVLKRCIDCGRDFVFFAKEQHYWFETLKIPSRPTPSVVSPADGRHDPGIATTSDTPTSPHRPCWRMLHWKS